MSSPSIELSFSGVVDTSYKYLPYIITDSVSSIRFSVLTNLDIAIDVYWSIDGITSLTKDTFTVTSSDGVSKSYPIKARYVKITIVNTNFPSTPTVTLQTLLFHNAPRGLVDLENVGAGVQLYKTNDQQIRSVISSNSSILLTQNNDTVDIKTFANSIGLQSTGATYSILYDDVGPTFITKTINTTNLNIIDEGTNLLISNDIITLGSTGGNSLVSDGVGPNLSIKGLEGGSFINIVASDTNLLINSNTQPVPTIVLTGGLGINVLSAYPNFTIVNTLPYVTTVLTNVGATSHVLIPTGFNISPNIQVKGLSAGTGMSITSTNSNILFSTGFDTNSAFAGLSSNASTLLTINPNTSILISPTFTTGMFTNMTTLNNAQIQYLGGTSRVFNCECDLDINPTHATNILSFSLCRNQTNILDTAKTFTLGGYQHVTLKSLATLAPADNIGVYMSHNNAVSTVVTTNMNYFNLAANQIQIASQLYNTTGLYQIPAATYIASGSGTFSFTTTVNIHPNVQFTPPSTSFTINASAAYAISFSNTVNQFNSISVLKNAIVVYTQANGSGFTTNQNLSAGDVCQLQWQKGGSTGNGLVSFSFVS